MIHFRTLWILTIVVVSSVFMSNCSDPLTRFMGSATTTQVLKNGIVNPDASGGTKSDPGGSKSSDSSGGLDLNLNRICQPNNPPTVAGLGSVNDPYLVVQVFSTSACNGSPTSFTEVSLKGINPSVQGRLAPVHLNLDALKTPAGQQPKYVVIQACDDPNHFGICLNKNPFSGLVSVTQVAFKTDQIPSSANLEIRTLDNNVAHCESLYDPLVAVLADEPLELAAKVRFDIDNSGRHPWVDWITSPHAGYFAVDDDDKGNIDSGAKLLGTARRLKNGLYASSGFEALADLVEDGRKSLTPADAAYEKLKIWIDKNHNGISEPGEIFSLRELGIDEIPLQPESVYEVNAQGDKTLERLFLKRRGGLPLRLFDIEPKVSF